MADCQDEEGGRSKAENGSDAAASLRDSDSLMDFINNHSWCRNNEGKKRLRKAEKNDEREKDSGTPEGGEN